MPRARPWTSPDRTVRPPTANSLSVRRAGLRPDSPYLEADGCRRRQRALRQPRTRAAAVVLAGSDVVGPAGVEERREHLDVAPPDAELELTAPVHLDRVGIAVHDALEHACDASEAGGLDVHPPRLNGERLDVGDGMDRRVEAQPPLLPAKHFTAFAVKRSVLD